MKLIRHILDFKNPRLTIKNRIGDLWWYTLILFVTMRIGDVLQAVVALWLVPIYVPTEELGAVLPLISIGWVLGLPLTILLIPFMKFLSKYMAQGEYGKVKKLLRDTFILTCIVFVVMSGVAHFLMPLVFERMRVENGRLSILIITSGIIGALTPVFITALQALKKFKTISIIGVFSAFIRLGTMLIFLPIRGLSGYFIGQITPNLFNIGVAMFQLRDRIGRNIRMVSYWNEDWKPILKYTGWIAVLQSTGTLQFAVENIVIRHRLPYIESAGYYMISRFAEISFFAGFTCVMVLFPMVSESHEKNDHGSQTLLWQSMLFSGGFGVAFAILMGLTGPFIFSLKPEWAIYQKFVPHMVCLCLIHAIRGGTLNCFSMHQLACNSFSYIKWFILFGLCDVVLLYGLLGYGFFTPYVPSGWIKWIGSLHVERLSVVLGIMFIFSLLPLLYAAGVTWRNAYKNIGPERIGNKAGC